MKRLTLLFLLVLFFVAASLGQAQNNNSPQSGSGFKCALTTEDYAVFSALIDDLGKPEDPEEAWAGKEILIVDETTEPSDNVKSWGSGLGSRSNSNGKPATETFTDFLAKSSEKCHVDASFGDPKVYGLIQRQELDKYFKKGPRGWEGFYKQHRNAAGYWDFSRPGYDPKGEEAVLYVGHHCGGLCGTGHFYLLRKKHGKWRVENRVMLWIS
jgi:hypothetical protein